MKNQAIDSGFVRLSELLVRINDLAKHQQKKALYRAASSALRDFDDYLVLAYEQAGITDEDLEKFAQDEVGDEALIKMAGHSPISTNGNAEG